MTQDPGLEELVALARELDALPQASVVGEGSVARRIDADSIWVKASGTPLGAVSAESFVRVRQPRVSALVTSGVTALRDIHLGLEDAKVDLEAQARPSRDTPLHAVCLELDVVRVVARTQPTAVNVLACAKDAVRFAQLRLTPDHVAICGPASVFVPFAFPVVPLAAAVRAQVAAFCDRHGTHPRVVVLQNNGLLALARDGDEALAITRMAIEIATLVAQTVALGGAQPLSDADIARLPSLEDPFFRPAVRRVR